MNGNYPVQLVSSSACNSDTFSVQVQVTSLGLPEPDFEKVKFLTRDEVMEISADVPGFYLEVFSIDGKLLVEKRNRAVIKRSTSVTLPYC